MINDELIDLDDEQRKKLAKLFLNRYLNFNNSINIQPYLIKKDICEYILNNSMKFSFLDKIDEFLLIKFLFSYSVHSTLDKITEIYNGLKMLAGHSGYNTILCQSDLYKNIIYFIILNIRNGFHVISNENFINFFLKEDIDKCLFH